MRTQLYPHSELCFANDASTNPQIAKILDRVALDDSRIKVVHCKVNGRISQATNSALELVTAEFAALLDHDDLLHRPALHEIAVVLQNADAVDAVLYQ
ncbi:MAG: glycosyltransferase [Pseudomonadota bacterium]|nr:glycosyltransferase [Pseudomonadota bacterium]